MRKILFILLLFQIESILGQNVKIEISDYHKVLDGKIYATYQYVNSSYSYSRPTLILITKKDLLVELSKKISQVFSGKQEYTDVWILGIADFDQKNISEVETKIIDLFLKQITKYRIDNSLPEYSFERVNASKKYISTKEEICNFLLCKNRK